MDRWLNSQLRKAGENVLPETNSSSTTTTTGGGTSNTLSKSASIAPPPREGIKRPAPSNAFAISSHSSSTSTTNTKGSTATTNTTTTTCATTTSTTTMGVKKIRVEASVESALRAVTGASPALLVGARKTNISSISSNSINKSNSTGSGSSTSNSTSNSNSTSSSNSGGSSFASTKPALVPLKPPIGTVVNTIVRNYSAPLKTNNTTTATTASTSTSSNSSSTFVRANPTFNMGAAHAGVRNGTNVSSASTTYTTNITPLTTHTTTAKNAMITPATTDIGTGVPNSAIMTSQDFETSAADRTAANTIGNSDSSSIRGNDHSNRNDDISADNMVVVVNIDGDDGIVTSTTTTTTAAAEMSSSSMDCDNTSMELSEPPTSTTTTTTSATTTTTASSSSTTAKTTTSTSSNRVVPDKPMSSKMCAHYQKILQRHAPRNLVFSLPDGDIYADLDESAIDGVDWEYLNAYELKVYDRLRRRRDGSEDESSGPDDDDDDEEEEEEVVALSPPQKPTVENRNKPIVADISESADKSENKDKYGNTDNSDNTAKSDNTDKPKVAKSQALLTSLMQMRQTQLEFYQLRGALRGSFWPDTSLHEDSDYQYRLYGSTTSYGKPLRITKERAGAFGLRRLQVHPLFGINTIMSGRGASLRGNNRGDVSSVIESAWMPACTCIKFDAIGSLFAVACASGRLLIYDFDEAMYLLQEAGNKCQEVPSEGLVTSDKMVSPEPLASFELKTSITTLCWISGLGLRTSSRGIIQGSQTEENHVAVACFDSPAIKIFDIRQRSRHPHLTLVADDSSVRRGATSMCHVPKHCFTAAGCTDFTKLFIAGDRGGMIRAWDLTHYCALSSSGSSSSCGRSGSSSSSSSSGGATITDVLWSIRGDPYSAAGTCGPIVSLQKSVVPMAVVLSLKGNRSKCAHENDDTSAHSTARRNFYEPPCDAGRVPTCGEFSDSPKMLLVLASITSNSVLCLWDVCSPETLGNAPAFSSHSGAQPLLIKRSYIPDLCGGAISQMDNVVSVDYMPPRYEHKRSTTSTVSSSTSTQISSGKPPNGASTYDKEPTQSCPAAEMIAVIKFASGMLVTIDLLAPFSPVLAIGYSGSRRREVRYVGSGEEESPACADTTRSAALAMASASFISESNIAIIPSLSMSTGAPVLIDGGSKEGWAVNWDPYVTTFSNMSLMKGGDELHALSYSRSMKSSLLDNMSYVPRGPCILPSGLLVHEPSFTLPGRVWNTRRSKYLQPPRDQQKPQQGTLLKYTLETWISRDAFSPSSSPLVEEDSDNMTTSKEHDENFEDENDDGGYDVVETTHDLSSYLGFTSHHKSNCLWFEVASDTPDTQSQSFNAVGNETASEETNREDEKSKRYLDFLLGSSSSNGTANSRKIESAATVEQDTEMHEIRCVSTELIELKTPYFGPRVTNGFPIVYLRTDLVPTSDESMVPATTTTSSTTVGGEILTTYTKTALARHTHPKPSDSLVPNAGTSWGITTPTICSAIAAHPGSTTCFPAGLCVLGLVNGVVRIAAVPSYSTREDYESVHT